MISTDENKTSPPEVSEGLSPEPPSGATPVDVRGGAPTVALRTAWWALLIMVFLVPVVMSDFTVPGLETRLDFSSGQLVKLAVIRILTLVALGAWAWDVLRRGGRIRHTPVDWLITGFLVWVAITTFTSVHWPTALFGVLGRYEGFLTFTTYAVIYFLVLQLAETPLHARRLAQSLFLSSLLVAVYGLLQYTGVVMVPEDLEWQIAGRAFSTYGNPVILGGFLIFSVTVSLGLAFHEQRRTWRLLYWVGFGLNALALIVSFSRGAWMGAVISVILLSVMAWRQRVSLLRVDWIPAGACCLAAVGLLVRSFSSTATETNVIKRLSSIFQFGSGSGQTRTEIWQAAVAAIKDRPLFGWGADNFTFAFSRFKPIEYLRDAGSSSRADNAHNYPLHLATGIGILGALLFCGICVWTGVRSFRTVFGRSGGSGRIILGAFWAASAGYLIHLLAGLSVPGITFLLWIALALVLAPTARTRKVKPFRWRAPAIAVVVLVAGLGIAGQVVVLAADSAYVDSRDEFSVSLDDRTAAALRAIELNPYSPDHRAVLAVARAAQMAADLGPAIQAQESGDDPNPQVEALRSSFAKAESACMDAIAFTPGDHANYVNLAAVYNYAAPVLGEDLFRRSIETVERGLEVMPLSTAIRIQLAEALLGTGRDAEAVEALEYCLQLDPKDGSAALPLAYIYKGQGRTTEALAVLMSVEALAPGQAGVAGTIKALESESPPQ